MSEESSSSQSNRSWLDRLTQAFSNDAKSRDDILSFLRDAEKNSIIDAESLSIMESAIQMTEMQVREVMIPRPQMVTIKASDDPEDYMQSIITSAHSRFPVIGDDSDEVIGILLAKDLLDLILRSKLTRDAVKDLLRPATFVPESKRLNTLLAEFRNTRNHMAIVIDEYGNVSGLVTIEDVLEQIVGEIEDEHDFDEETMIKPQSENEFVVKAITPIEDFNEFFEMALDASDFDTIGGIVLREFGRVPHRDEQIEFAGFKITVLNADNRSIRLLKFEQV